MSFETVFERWLQKQEAEEAVVDDKKKKRQEAGVDKEDVADEEEMPVIQREAWKEEDMDGMPVLQKMVDLPSTQGERKLGSPPPPPLQITLSLTENSSKERQNRSCKSKSPGIDKDGSLNKAGSKGKDYDGCPVLQEISPHLKKSTIYRVQTEGEQNKSKLSQQKDPQDPLVKEKNVSQCGAKCALTELTGLSHIISPVAARGSEMEAVRSPECDLPMEPDSTSEFMFGSGRWLRARKGSEASRGEVSPWREVSPRSSTGSVGLRTPSGSNSEVMVRIEESPAECDSTSMFMNSPSAISPASQGEIEERVCPVLADHEDGASPSHFMCRCRSLLPPSDLMGRDHTPVTVASKSKLTVKASGTISCQAKSISPLVNRTHSVDDDTAPDLEKVAPSLDLMATSAEGLQSDHESPPVLTLPEQETRLKQFSAEHSHVKDILTDVNQQEAPPLIRFEPESPRVSHVDMSTCTKYCDSPPLLSSNDFDSQDKSYENPPVLSLHGQDTSSKLSKIKKQAEVCDFTSNIDWETAVVETVENPPNLTRYDGGSKPGIIIKIRTKGKSALPSVQLLSKPLSLPKAGPVKRKRHTVDNAEILSRLRKRHKSEESDNLAAPVPETEQVQVQSVRRKGVDKQQPKAVAGSGDSSVGHSRLKSKKARRNTVQVAEELTVSTQHLSHKDGMFVLSSVELSRLQILTHKLLCILFPRLQPHLIHVAPESRTFVSIIEDIILSLEHSTSEESVLDCEELNSMFKNLSLKRSQSVPVFSPQVVLCSSPGHVAEDFRGKLCALLQLLLPDLTVSLTRTLADSSQQLELFLKKLIVANKARAASRAQPTPLSV